MLTPDALKARLTEAGIGWTYVFTGYQANAITVFLNSNTRAEAEAAVLQIARMHGVMTAQPRRGSANNRVLHITVRP